MSFTITISAWIIPTVLTAFCLLMAFRPYHSQGPWDIGGITRVFWLFPLGFIWAAYFGLVLLLKG